MSNDKPIPEMQRPPAATEPASGAVARRDLLVRTGLTIAGSVLSAPVIAGPFDSDSATGVAPRDKQLRKTWLDSLTDRGKPTVYRGAELDKIGMPVGGIGAGQLYLGGDGRLWHWDIFNIPNGTGDGNYARPPSPTSPIEQGFILKVESDGRLDERPVDRVGFSEVTFSGSYPIGTVEYRDAGCPISVALEAFSPFIPLNADDSSLPATVMRFTLHNGGKKDATVSLTGTLENGVCLQDRSLNAIRWNEIVSAPGATFLNMSVERTAAPEAPKLPDRLLENWDKATYEGWTVEGAAFGKGPIKRSDIPAYQGDVGGEDDRVVNSHATAPGGDVGGKDSATGRLTSRPFAIDRRFLRFWIGGGSHKARTCLNLLVDGKPVRSATGRNDNRMAVASFDVQEFEGREARIEIVDAESGPWGNVGVGRITLSDTPLTAGKLEELPDFGTMTLALLGEPANASNRAIGSAKETVHTLADRVVGSVTRTLTLSPGRAAVVHFVVAWHFPNLEIGGLGRVGRWYATKFANAEAVARYIAANLVRLSDQTRLWRDTWYDSTLPYWLLDRTLLNISTLATSTCYRLASGRFYAWEGVGCCAGTCTHVWHYAQAMARLFPELERDIRERVDLGVAFHAGTGVIGFRAEFDPSLAVDGQAGTLLRVYREHQMSPDATFLKRCWPLVKAAFEPLFALDPDGDGLLEGAQMNTLDQPWFGKISWLSSLYVAALRAGEAMATEMGDRAFAAKCAAIAERGAGSIDSQLFNGEYYQQNRDAARPKTVGSYDGCEIDQVFGDSWARQVGLPDILPRPHVRKALSSLWRYNFFPDVGPFRAAHKAGRMYAVAGEAGLVMCSWPKGESARVEQGFDFYFNECMTGFEHQAAGHMIWHGLVQEGLAVERAIHDRYHAARRNPWNEVECGDHYGRAMASYGVYFAACGMEVHSPKAHLGFAPRVGPSSFRAAFTSAEGWGTLSQTIKAGKRSAAVKVLYGRLKLKTVSLAAAGQKRATVSVGGRTVACTTRRDGDRIVLTLATEVLLLAGQRLDIHEA